VQTFWCERGVAKGRAWKERVRAPKKIEKNQKKNKSKKNQREKKKKPQKNRRQMPGVGVGGEINQMQITYGERFVKASPSFFFFFFSFILRLKKKMSGSPRGKGKGEPSAPPLPDLRLPRWPSTFKRAAPGPVAIDYKAAGVRRIVAPHSPAGSPASPRSPRGRFGLKKKNALHPNNLYPSLPPDPVNSIILIVTRMKVCHVGSPFRGGVADREWGESRRGGGLQTMRDFFFFFFFFFSFFFFFFFSLWRFPHASPSLQPATAI
jgi:hypothetical protein